MSDEIRVKVNSYGPGRPLSLVWVDPITGKRKAKSAGTTDWREAERLAGEIEKQMQAGQYAAPSKITWAEFRKRCEEGRLASLAKKTRAEASTMFDYVDRLIAPDRLAKMTAQVVGQFQIKLRETGMAETTIHKHLRSLKAALRWAERQGMLAKAPVFEMPRMPKGQRMMKGRPITAEEFDRMIESVPKVRPDDAQDWIRLLNGLWLSGLRIGEAVALSWDDSASFSIDLTGKFPAFRIYAEAQKANRDEMLPMTPDFAEWLLSSVPLEQRVGFVFPVSYLGSGNQMPSGDASKVVSDIGEQAKVVVSRSTKKGNDAGKQAAKKETVKFASAHDLRRAFCTRWAKRVMPATLQRLARHSDITTTLNYYVAESASDIAAGLWKDFGNIYNTSYNSQDQKAPEVDPANCPKSFRINRLA